MRENNLHNQFIRFFSFIKELEPGCDLTNQEIAGILNINTQEVDELINTLLRENTITRYRENGQRVLKLQQESSLMCSAKSSLSQLSSLDNAKALSTNNNIINNKHQSVHIGRRPEKSNRDQLKNATKPTYKTKSPVATPKIVFVINFWNSLGLKQCNQGTKSFDNAVKWIKRARRGLIPIKNEYKFTYEEIKTAINRFNLSIKDPHYFPPEEHPLNKRLQQVSLGEFVYNKYSTKSWMIEYLDNDLKKIDDLSDLDDQYPDVSSFFSSVYTKKVLGGIHPPEGFNDYDKSCFIKAANRTVEFFKTNRKRMNLHVMGGQTVLGFSKLVWEAVSKSVHGEVDKLTPGWLCSDTTFHKRLPSFLYKEGVIQDRREMKI